MTYTVDDVGTVPMPDGTVKELSLQEKQALVDQWNRNFTETPEQVIKRLESAIDRHLDAVANSYRYESIRTMVTYATSDHQTFGPEGRAAVKFRDAVYAYGIQVSEDVLAGLRPIPTEEELLAGVPLITDYFQ